MEKTCTKCQKKKPITKYYKERKSKDGLRTDCKECSETRRRKRLNQMSRKEKAQRTAERRIKHAEAERAYSKKRRQKYRANELIRLARLRAKKKGLAFDLDQHEAELFGRVEKNVCEMTGIALQRDVPKAWNTPSLDRIDPAKGYVYSNVRVVCYALNCAMGTWGEGPLMEILQALKKRLG